MIINPMNDKLQRDAILEKCREIKKCGGRVIDVGGSLGFWAREVVTHYIDLIDLDDSEKDKIYFWADISNPLTWKNILSYIKENGKFDYAICTQTLEHTTDINCAVSFLTRIAEKGFVSVPNKYVELKFDVAFGEEGLERCNLSGIFRGFLPHRWIFTIKEEDSIRKNVFWAFPKLNFVDRLILPWVEENFIGSNELSFEWESNIPAFVVPDEYIDHPDPEKAIKFYYKHLKGGL